MQAELQQLTEQREQLIAQIAERDQEIATLDQNIAQRDRVIAQRESRLKALEIQQDYLEQEAQNLITFYEDTSYACLSSTALIFFFLFT